MLSTIPTAPGKAQQPLLRILEKISQVHRDALLAVSGLALASPFIPPQLHYNPTSKIKLHPTLHE